MGEMLSVWDAAATTVLDVSLPGTHDTMTYDLSTTVSDRANDLDELFAYLLHEFGGEIPELGEFIRNQSGTQSMNITQQLDGGVRFIDFRIQYTRGPTFVRAKRVGREVDGQPQRETSASQKWYCLHFMETQHTALSYLQEIHSWLVDHPTEILVLWMSKHGSQCENSQFDDVSIDAKWQYVIF